MYISTYTYIYICIPLYVRVCIFITIIIVVGYAPMIKPMTIHQRSLPPSVTISPGPPRSYLGSCQSIPQGQAIVHAHPREQDRG